MYFSQLRTMPSSNLFCFTYPCSSCSCSDHPVCFQCLYDHVLMSCSQLLRETHIHTRGRAMFIHKFLLNLRQLQPPSRPFPTKGCHDHSAESEVGCVNSMHKICTSSYSFPLLFEPPVSPRSPLHACRCVLVGAFVMRYLSPSLLPLPL